MRTANRRFPSASAALTSDKIVSLPTPRDGAELLDEVRAFLCRFVAYPSEAAAVAHTVWSAHCYVVEAFEMSPRLAFLSPEPGSGKTRALELTATLVPNPVHAVNVTAAYLFRRVGQGSCTVLLDEADTIFGNKPTERSEEIRALVNAGHRRGATVGRCIVKGKEVIPVKCPAFAPVALAGLHELPPTIMSRAVVIRMRRRGPGEHVEPFRIREHEPQGHRLRDELANWLLPNTDRLRDARPEMPDGVTDRPADCWEPLLAIADLTGSAWTRRRPANAGCRSFPT
jgi:hypothetical protein